MAGREAPTIAEVLERREAVAESYFTGPGSGETKCEVINDPCVP
jgi:hypothetical protein